MYVTLTPPETSIPPRRRLLEHEQPADTSLPTCSPRLTPTPVPAAPGSGGRDPPAPRPLRTCPGPAHLPRQPPPRCKATAGDTRNFLPFLKAPRNPGRPRSAPAECPVQGSRARRAPHLRCAPLIPGRSRQTQPCAPPPRSPHAPKHHSLLRFNSAETHGKVLPVTQPINRK